jgi:hypothetical protein
MGTFLYFAFGALNIGLIFLFTHIYRHWTGVDMMPGRENGNKFEMVTTLIAYFLCGVFGTGALLMLGVILFIMWKSHYRKN